MPRRARSWLVGLAVAVAASACATAAKPGPAAPLGPAAAPPAAARPVGGGDLVKIVEVNDLHVAADPATMDYPSKVIDAMNGEGAALALVCGDVSLDGLEPELQNAKTVLGRLRMPHYVVIGNHDASPQGDEAQSLWKTVFAQPETTYAFEEHGIHFVGIDHGNARDFERNSVRPPVLERLTQIAARIPAGAPVILFSHYPFGPGVRYETPNAAEVIAIFAKQRVLAVVSGHFHGNSERRQGGVLFTTTASASSTRKNHDGSKPKGYRVLTIRAGRDVTTEFREVAP